VRQEHTLTARGLREAACAQAAEVDVDDQRRPRALLVERGRFGELLRPSAQRGESAPAVRRGQRDRVVDV
jgi:hypothetical protein